VGQKTSTLLAEKIIKQLQELGCIPVSGQNEPTDDQVFTFAIWLEDHGIWDTP